MEIRKLNSGDWEIYKELRLEALQKDAEAFGSSYEESLKKTNEEWKKPLENQKNNIMVAFYGDKVIGMVGANQESGQKTKHVAYVWGVYVNADHRGQGVAKKIMKTLLDEIMKNKEIEKINLNVNTTQNGAISLYEKLGFEIVGTLHKELKIGDKYFDEYMMEKFLY